MSAGPGGAAAAVWRGGPPGAPTPTPARFLELGRRFSGSIRLAVGDNGFTLGSLLPNLGASILEPNLKVIKKITYTILAIFSLTRNKVNNFIVKRKHHFNN